MFYWNEKVNLPKTRYSVYLGQKPPPQSWRWEPSSGSVLTGDYNWSEMLSGFQSVTLFGETSGKNMYNANRIRSPVSVDYAHLFNARVFIYLRIYP